MFFRGLVIVHPYHLREVAPLACSTCYNWGIVGMSNGVVYGHHVSTFIEICGGIWIPLSFFVLAKGAFNVVPAFHSPTAQRSAPEGRLHFVGNELVHFYPSFYAHRVGVGLPKHGYPSYYLIDVVAVVNVYKAVG